MPENKIVLPPQPKLGRESWQCKVVEATRGNTTQLGAIIVAILRQTPASGKRCFGQTAVITSDHMVLCDFTDRDGGLHRSAFVCSVRDLKTNLARLADHCKLSDDERKELFAAARGWISHDYSPEGQGLKEAKK